MSAETVVRCFFNQMVQFIIDDMVVVEAKSEETRKTDSKEKLVKDYKDLVLEDLQAANVVAVSGTKISLAKRQRREGNLQPIKEEMSETNATISNMSTEGSSSLQDLDMDEESYVRITFNNGNVYEGCIYRRIMHGKGRYKWADGTVYEGNFFDGFPTGVGKMILPDLRQYNGDFNHGLFHGNGFLNIVSTPTFYNGEWKNGKKHGQGWLLYEPGDWYEGGWANGLKDGFGLRYYKSGAKYRGMWRQGKYEGEGIMIWENNDYYKGEWKKGLMHGNGEYIWRAFYNDSFAFPNQNIYKGEWEDGKRSGKGVMIFGDQTGLKLEGNWEKDFKHGSGLLVCGNGRTVKQDNLFHYDKHMQIENLTSSWSIKSHRHYRNKELPIFTAPEYVDVGFYVDQILAKLQGVSLEKLKLLKSFEERCISHVIIKYLLQLKDLYHEYATVAAKSKLSYEPVLIRLFLWKLYKDKEIWRRGISLAETDKILASNPQSCLDTLHNPFELIYFWQFLMFLIGIALTTCCLDDIYDITEQGVAASVVKKFFDEIIFAKAADHTTSLMLNYMNLAPIKSVYALYQKLGEPHSARTFLRESCGKKDQTPIKCHLELFFQKAEPKFGSNLVPLNHDVIFKIDSDAQPNEEVGRNWTNLFDFRHLGVKNIVRSMAQACPLIMADGLMVDMHYPLTFIEFYETLLICIFLVLELELKKEHKIVAETLPPKLELSNKSLKSQEMLEKNGKGKKKKEKKEKKKKPKKKE